MASTVPCFYFNTGVSKEGVQRGEHYFLEQVRRIQAVAA